MDVQGIARITREVTMVLENMGEAIKPREVVTKPQQQELIKGKVSFVRDEDKLQLKMKKLSSKQVDDILAYISDYLK